MSVKGSPVFLAYSASTASAPLAAAPALKEWWEMGLRALVSLGLLSYPHWHSIKDGALL